LEVTEVEEIYQDAISKIREDMDEDES
jgi:hypothetical protein